MARFRDFVDRAFLAAMERRIRKDGKTAAGAANPIDERNRQVLIALLRERDDQIEGLKASVEKRNGMIRKNVAGWRAKQTEVRKIRLKNRTLRRLLRERRGALRAALERVRGLEKKVSEQAPARSLAVVGQPIPLPFDQGPAKNLGEWICRKVGELTLLPWRHWMRIGSYFQYDPRPVEHDRIPEVKRIGGGWPRLTLVTPSYQQAEYLEETLRSVLDQNYPNLEYFVLDGGSKDGSVEIIRKYADRLAGWQSQPDGGQAAAVREGLSRGTGEIMAWINSDDLIYPGTLAYVADYFDRHPEVDVIYGHRIIIDKNSAETARWIYPPHDSEILPWSDFLPQECTFWRRRIYEKVGGMDPDFRFALDWDLFLRFQQAGAKMVRIPYFTGGFRIHPEQKNAVTINSDGFREMRRIRDEALGDLFQRGGLLKRINRYQTKGVVTAILWRLGIRL